MTVTVEGRATFMFLTDGHSSLPEEVIRLSMALFRCLPFLWMEGIIGKRAPKLFLTLKYGSKSPQQQLCPDIFVAPDVSFEHFTAQKKRNASVFNRTKGHENFQRCNVMSYLTRLSLPRFPAPSIETLPACCHFFLSKEL